jgi:23S rRNA pseudouridine2457 synthase
MYKYNSYRKNKIKRDTQPKGDRVHKFKHHPQPVSKPRDSLRYLLFWKPYRVLCQFTPSIHDHQSTTPKTTLKEFIQVPDVYPIGRLDYESEGLLLLSNDGLLQHKLCNPKFKHPRSYWVQVEGIPNHESIQALQQGVVIKGSYRTQPAQVTLIEPPHVPLRQPPIRVRKNIPTQWLHVQLIEGKNRQIRRMTASVNHPTLRLIRSQISCFSLLHPPTNPTILTVAGLSPGEWRELTQEEIKALQSCKV